MRAPAANSPRQHATPRQPRPVAPPPLPESWSDALIAFDDDLRRRAVADKTRRAYAIDSASSPRWAGERGLEPATIDVRALRRYAAGLSEHRCAPSTVARKLAALRGLFAVLVHTGARAENPAELLSSPKRAQRLPRVLKPSEVAALLDRIPATTSLELRDRALFELAYASGLRAEELVSLDVEALDFDAETVRVEGKGGKTRIVPAGEHALRSLHRYLERARPALQVPDERRAVCLQVGPAAEHVGCAGGGCAPGRGTPPPARPRSGTPIRTRCDIRLRPICWRGARTCARSRSCSGMRASRRRRSTLG